MKQDNTPHKTGKDSYNRQSGKKTLVFVGVCMGLVILLSLLALLALLSQ